MGACSVSDGVRFLLAEQLYKQGRSQLANVTKIRKKRRTSSSRGSVAVLLSGLLLSACMLEAQATWPLKFLCRTAFSFKAMLRFALPHHLAGSAVHGALP